VLAPVQPSPYLNHYTRNRATGAGKGPESPAATPVAETGGTAVHGRPGVLARHG